MDLRLVLALASIVVGLLLAIAVTWLAWSIAHAARGQTSEQTSERTEETSMPQTGTFATAINCIDGRAQEPVAHWVKRHAQVDFVDTPTIPGPDKVLTQGPPPRIDLARQDVEVSVRAHGSRFVAVAGHFGCAANPVSPEEHKQMIRDAVGVVQGWGMRDDEGRPVRVVGLWVTDSWQIEQVADTGA